jgi:hypothetical protein
MQRGRKRGQSLLGQIIICPYKNYTPDKKGAELDIGQIDRASNYKSRYAVIITTPVKGVGKEAFNDGGNSQSYQR